MVLCFSRLVFRPGEDKPAGDSDNEQREHQNNQT